MSLLNDLANEIASYATDSCKTEIVNFSIAPPGGVVLNRGEIFQFKVRVENEGHLDMKGVTVRALGTSFADVGLSAGSFGAEATSGSFDLAAHQTHTTGFFRGKAKAITGVAKDIVTAKIQSWDASLDHLLKDCSDPGQAEAKLTKDIKQE